MMQKNSIKVNFAAGIDSKTDPKQLQIGQFTALQNSVFDVGGQLTKRNGFQELPALPSANYAYLDTFNDDLTAIGNNIAAYSIPTDQWIQKGSYQPMSVSVLPAIRNNFNQSSADVAVAANGLACTTYLENRSGAIFNQYSIFDSVTGQNIVAPTTMPAFAGTVSGGMRVFVVGAYFVMVATYTSGGSSFLQYTVIPTATPNTASVTATLSSAYRPQPGLSWDAVVAKNGNLYFAYQTTTSGTINVSYLTPALAITGLQTITTPEYADLMSVCSDDSGSTPVIYLNWYDESVATYVASLSSTLTPGIAPFPTSSGTLVKNITASVQSTNCLIFFEVPNTDANNSAEPANYIYFVYFTSFIVSQGVSIRGLGLGSKSFIYNNSVYYVGSYQSTYQPTYFLVNGSVSTAAAPNIVAKLASGNGGGYSTTGLPTAEIVGNKLTFPYQFKDLLQAVNKNTNVPSGTQVNGIFSQTGINLATILFTSDTTDSEEIGNDLHISGGFLWMYDGYLPVEHNFFYWPDYVLATYSGGSASPTGTFTSGSTSIVVSSAAGIGLGMTITDGSNPSYIPAGTIVTSISGTTLTISQATTHGATGDSLLLVGNVAEEPDGSTYVNAYYYQVTYEWSDNQGNIFRSAPSIPLAVTTISGSGLHGIITLKVPTLRATMKTASPVKIVIYRWSVAQQEYYQVTSVTSPLLNDTTVDSVIFIDANADATILGNNLLYTTGGVVEDVAAPASNLFTLFDARLWLVDAEDPNLVWYSKQVIEATPVEMSDLFTIYVPPSVGTSLNTGPITAISTMDDKLLLAKSTSWVYINGTGPDNTGANSQYSQPIYITSTVGCTNQRSIVLSPNGLMFQSSKGIWLIGRDLQCSYIGAAVQQYTNGALVTSAELMPSTTQVRFTLDSGITLMYDYYYGQWATFNVPAVSSCIFQGLHTYIDSSANVWQENPGSYLDGNYPVNMSFTTGPIRLGELDNYQRMYFFYLLGTYYSPHFLTMSLTYDYGASPSQTIVIEPGTQVGITSGSLEAWRIFPMTQRCRAISLTLTESYDATIGPAAGQGLTLSGVNFVCGFKKAFVPTSSANSAG